ncbi:hypothetical protein [Nocardioides sp.]|jgi:hypothetical protein|nr:hypothetical protein [Nocardioides sp.]
MSSTPITEMAPGAVRVRHQAREAAALMAFSAATSVGVALSLLLVASLGR